jgi:hypothetical protein
MLTNITTNSSPFSAKVKNERSCASLTSVCPYGMNRANFTFLHILFLIRKWELHWVERPQCQFRRL